MVFDVFSPARDQERGWQVPTETCPARKALLYFSQIGLIEHPDRPADGNIGIGDGTEALVVAAFHKQVGNETFLYEPDYHSLQCWPVEHLKILVGHEAVRAVDLAPENWTT